MATGNYLRKARGERREVKTRSLSPYPSRVIQDHVYQEQSNDVKPHDRLVLVSYGPRGPSTPSLSNSSSTSGLQGACAPGELILRHASRLDAFSDYRHRT